MSTRMVGTALVCLAVASCSPDTPTAPTSWVSTAKPISRAVPLNFPAGVYRLTLRSYSRGIEPSIPAPCDPQGSAPIEKLVLTEVELVRENDGFFGRATGGSDSLVLRLRDAGPNYIGSRTVSGTISGTAAARGGTALAVEVMNPLELSGSGGSETTPEATTATLSFAGPVRFLEATGGAATCRSASAYLELVSRFRG